MEFRHRYALALSALLIGPASASVAAQSPGTPSASQSPTMRAFYLQRGDEVEQRYKLHREHLQRFFGVLSARFEEDAPELKPKLAPPSPVAFGYQILPNLTNDPAATNQRSRIRLSPFSWPRTDSIIGRGRDSLAALELRFDSASRLPAVDRKRAYAPITDSYKRLVDGQKFMESLIQYNRLWQSEIARLTEGYRRNNSLRDAALSRQALMDSVARADASFRQAVQPRIDSLSSRLHSALKKGLTPDFIRVDHPAEHAWVVTVPIYTDIADSAFVARAKETIENGWHVVDGADDFSVRLDIRRIARSQLFANTAVPANGEHIDVTAHLRRFPQDGIVLTTGANTTYVYGQSIILGPNAIPRRTLVHEFGHMLGFRDGYFRSYEDLGENGFNVVEIILDPNDIVTTPENGKASRQHFDQVLADRGLFTEPQR
jgi:hypothetical protein